ncbi:cupin domain-containing protein [Enterococcus dongliensis]|uniref:cupin domain-containing protein n=1 Tax=Enterococcus dongliensis TaxID=2559925 RepID=UPI00288FE8C4|nr:cupin domain-containing protein [Enterococcus dongliensis]MDT2640319.1 cupin domain-containing protein [Enterococcus dongliensis]
MKKLICVENVTQAHEKNESIVVDQDTIITPAAKDLIETFQVPLKECDKQELANVELPDNVNKATLLQLLKMILAGETQPFSCEKHSNGLKVIRGNSVEMAVFDTGNPEAKVFYQELVSKEESKISAGFLEINHSQFDWELTYEEIDYVISGTLEVTIEGKKYTAYPGDVVFVPKNSKVTWGSPDKVKLFYATYPANWSDLI